LVLDQGLTSVCKWMLTRDKLKLGKGKLASYKSDIGKIFWRHKIASKKGEEEDQPMKHEDIGATLQSLMERVEDFQWIIQNHVSGESSIKGEGVGEGGGGPSEHPSPSSLWIFLYTHETLLNYICGMHSYIHHTILMFTPTNIDKVLVWVTHLEASKGNNASEYKKPYTFKNKLKGKWKSKKSYIVEKDEEIPTCSHFKKNEHKKSQC